MHGYALKTIENEDKVHVDTKIKRWGHAYGLLEEMLPQENWNETIRLSDIRRIASGKRIEIRSAGEAASGGERL